MVRSNLEMEQVGARARLRRFWKGLKEVDKFYQGKDAVHQTLRRLVKKLEKAKIPYVVVGGMAVSYQGYRRPTRDVDVLLTSAGFADFQRLFVPKDYEQVGRRPRRFVDRKNKVEVDILVTGLFPGTGRSGPIAYPDPDEVSQTIEKIHFLNLVTLIQLKLAARRHQNFADVVHLIGAHNLDESFLEKLHPSLHRDFIECLEEKQREEEYEARQ